MNQASSSTPFKLKTVAPSTARLEQFKLFAPHCLDSYKLGHRKQYPQGTEYVYSNFTPRNDSRSPLPEDYRDWYVVAGITGLIRGLVALWDETFFTQPKAAVLAKYEARVGAFSCDDITSDHLAALHDLGYLPLRVKAVKEGTLLRINTPCLTVVNTLTEFFWLTNSLETYISNELWKSITNATTARAMHEVLTVAAEETGSSLEFVDWQGHCFADRGMAGMMDAAKNCAPHSMYFLGTDSVSSMDYLDWTYPKDKGFNGGSVNATEHSVMCVDGSDNELETFRRLIRGPLNKGVASIVSDTWDFWKVITEYAAILKEDILARQPDALGMSKLVFRPDSGNPLWILCGTSEAANDRGEVQRLLADQNQPVRYSGGYLLHMRMIGPERKVVGPWEGASNVYWVEATPAEKGAVECLWDVFGGTHTEPGFRLLCNRVGLIYGDSINVELADLILQTLMRKGYASGNVVFGVGSYSYQYVSRDSLGCAIKATYAVVNGQGRALFKDPKTDSGMKKSHKGLIRVNADGGYTEVGTWEEEDQGLLELRLENGNLFLEETFSEVKKWAYDSWFGAPGGYASPELMAQVQKDIGYRETEEV